MRQIKKMQSSCTCRSVVIIVPFARNHLAGRVDCMNDMDVSVVKWGMFVEFSATKCSKMYEAFVNGIQFINVTTVVE